MLEDVGRIRDTIPPILTSVIDCNYRIYILTYCTELILRLYSANRNLQLCQLQLWFPIPAPDCVLCFDSSRTVCTEFDSSPFMTPGSENRSPRHDERVCLASPTCVTWQFGSELKIRCATLVEVGSGGWRYKHPERDFQKRSLRWTQHNPTFLTPLSVVKGSTILETISLHSVLLYRNWYGEWWCVYSGEHAAWLECRFQIHQWQEIFEMETCPFVTLSLRWVLQQCRMVWRCFLRQECNIG